MAAVGTRRPGFPGPIPPSFPHPNPLPPPCTRTPLPLHRSARPAPRQPGLPFPPRAPMPVRTFFLGQGLVFLGNHAGAALQHTPSNPVADSRRAVAPKGGVGVILPVPVGPHAPNKGPFYIRDDVLPRTALRLRPGLWPDAGRVRHLANAPHEADGVKSPFSHADGQGRPP